MRGISDEQKAEAQRAYRAGESMASIANRLQVRRQTLIAMRDRETAEGSDAWTVQPTAQVSASEAKAVRERTTAQVIDIATRKAVQQAEAAGVIDEQVDLIATNLRVHGDLVAAMSEAVQNALDDFNSRGAALDKHEATAMYGYGKSRADYLNSLADATKKVIAMGRDTAGLKPGQGSAKPDTVKKPSVLKLVIVDKPEEQRKAS